MSLNNLKIAADKIKKARSIVIIQADNPDGDSLASTLALEAILGDQGKTTHLYCRVQIPRHLRHLPGWDRVVSDLPNSSDLAIIVDASQEALMEGLFTPVKRLNNKSVIIIDHHDYTPNIPVDFTALIDSQTVSTGEVIYDIAQKLGWSLDAIAREMIAVSILYDSLGLTTEATTPKSIRVIASLVESGVSLAKIDDDRRATMKKSVELMRYKANLMKRIEFFNDNNLALVIITWAEIEKYSDQYNPAMLVMEEMRMVSDVKVAVALKVYDSGKITGKIRSNRGAPVAAKMAEHFGGGGHEYAAGFKVHDSSTEEVKRELIQFTKAVKYEHTTV